MKKILIKAITALILMCFTLGMSAACAGPATGGAASLKEHFTPVKSPITDTPKPALKQTPTSTPSLPAAPTARSTPAPTKKPVMTPTTAHTKKPTTAPTPEPTTTPTVHQHVYRGANCTAGGVCDCGATGPALGHSFSEATCTAPAACTRCGLMGEPAMGHSYSGGYCVRCGDTNGPLSPNEAKWFSNSLTDEQNAQALKVARSIVASIPEGSDLERVSAAAAAVSDYYYNGVHSEPIPGHEAEHNRYYREAYGVFIAGESSCAGCTRALGLILSVMGYTWTHVNENQYEHQWITLTMDGREGFADGQVGLVGYGKHPLDD